MKKQLKIIIPIGATLTFVSVFCIWFFPFLKQWDDSRELYQIPTSDELVALVNKTNLVRVGSKTSLSSNKFLYPDGDGNYTSSQFISSKSNGFYYYQYNAQNDTNYQLSINYYERDTSLISNIAIINDLNFRPQCFGGYDELFYVADENNLVRYCYEIVDDKSIKEIGSDINDINEYYNSRNVGFLPLNFDYSNMSIMLYSNDNEYKLEISSSFNFLIKFINKNEIIPITAFSFLDRTLVLFEFSHEKNIVIEHSWTNNVDYYCGVFDFRIDSSSNNFLFYPVFNY